MKTLYFALLLSCSALLGQEPLFLSGKATLSNTHGYFVLSDGSCWKVIPFEKRWRSLSEWWNGIDLNVPENLETLPKYWEAGAQVEVLAKEYDNTLDEGAAYNLLDLKQCSHLLYNVDSREVLFARAMDPATFMVAAFNSAHKEGEQVGYENGYMDGYNSGYISGYDAGYETRAEEQRDYFE